MSKRGPIILVDDDEDDLRIFGDLLRAYDIKNEIITFTSSDEAYYYLVDHTNVSPLIIICDINLPQLNGIELKRKIDDHHTLRRKSIPFVFHCTSSNPKLIDEAFSLCVQGYFVKDDDLEKSKKTFRTILDYWIISRQPGD